MVTAEAQGAGLIVQKPFQACGGIFPLILHWPDTLDDQAQSSRAWIFHPRRRKQKGNNISEKPSNLLRMQQRGTPGLPSAQLTAQTCCVLRWTRTSRSLLPTLGADVAIPDPLGLISASYGAQNKLKAFLLVPHNVPQTPPPQGAHTSEFGAACAD